MKNIIAAAAITVTAAVAVLLAAPSAQAGNNTNNFHLKGQCSANVGGPFLGATMKLSNYDNGKNQTYHLSWSRSGVAYSVLGYWINGVYKGKASDMYIGMPGHGPNTVTFKTTILGSSQNCSVRR